MTASAYPKISIVTPSYNMGRYLEATIKSVLDQGYPNLEYVVIDGGSTDGSVEILRRYENRLSAWVSEPDGGMYDAINKGFARTTGEIMAWINADDMYTPWAFKLVAEVFSELPEVEWLTTLALLLWDLEGKAVELHNSVGYCRKEFMRGENAPVFDESMAQHPKAPRIAPYTPWGLWRAFWLWVSRPFDPALGGKRASLRWHTYFKELVNPLSFVTRRLEGNGRGGAVIQQESTFWRRSLWQRAGGRVDTAWPLAGDFELWTRFFQHADLYGVRAPIGGFRAHGDQKTAHALDQYCEEAGQILARYGGRVCGSFEAFVRRRLLPSLPARRLLWGLGLLNPRPLCIHRGRRGGWEIGRQ